MKLIAYVVFGVLTTLINIASYYLAYNIFAINNVTSTIIAWVIAVAFAFITNKLWVFDSKKFNARTLLHEIPAFFVCRLATGVLDVSIMYFAVDLLAWHSLTWKLISNVLVIVMNYLASKFVIFNRSLKSS